VTSVNDELARRFVPVVIGARVGDAMGAPTEGMTPEDIGRRFGWVDGFAGDGTDDSLMATLLAEALLASDGHAGADEWAAQWIANHDRILAMRESFFPSVLHTAEKLVHGFPPRRVAAGNMPSTSSAMCIWPIGLVHAGNPRAAAEQAYAVAALIHSGEVDFCQDAAAAVAAAVAAGLRPGTTASDACHDALSALHPVSGAPMRDLIGEAVSLADDTSGYHEFRERYPARFHQSIFCDSRETVPAAFALAVLADGRLPEAVEYAANFGRDTDTIASMAGALCGAVSEPDAVPHAWTSALGPDALSSAQTLAARLARLAQGMMADRIRRAGAVPGLLPGDEHPSG
jgi:ADP-ribosylglycohydrolase